MRDLTHEPADVVAAERAKVATDGWGALLLAHRDPDGQWGSGAFFPAAPPSGPGQPWTATLWSLALLKELGLDPESPEARETVALVGENSKWEYAGQPFWEGEVEPCINGRTVGLGAYFGVDVSPIVDLLLTEQMRDGGWNCEQDNGSIRGSFRTTLDVLDGLLEYEIRVGASKEVAEARHLAEEYLLERKLMRRLSTGEVIDPAWTRLSFPPRGARYDILRALVYLRAAGVAPDERTAEAIDLVESKRDSDGRWLLEETLPGDVYFHMEEKGQPSRWITLRAMPVMEWAGR